MTCDDVNAPAAVLAIQRGQYADFQELKHLFLVGDLKKQNPHPFCRDSRIELILCFYHPGDDGIRHWHRDVTEYEFVLEGQIGYFEVASGHTRWFHPGDLCIVPAGACVGRLVRTETRTLTVKVPSADEKVCCAACPRTCGWRRAPLQEG